MKNLIFICYRCSDEPFAALFLEAKLADRFGRGQVFRDTRSIPLGTEFPDRLGEALHQCRALVAVIGPDWLGRNRDGTRRIDSAADYVRREIATALRRRVLVVPVLVGNASLPAVAKLPPDLAGIANRQYLQLRVRTADADAVRLVDELAEAVGGPELSRPRTAFRRSVLDHSNGVG